MNNLEIFGIPYFKKGSGIHIKKENRGLFTDYCGGKVTNECIQRAKKSKNPKLRKRATFAQNARAWKHQQGGPLQYQGPTYTEVQEQWAKEDPLSYNTKQIKTGIRQGDFIYYTDAKGKQQRIPASIGLSGTDPVARDVVIGAGVGKFIGPVINKVTSFMKKPNISNTYTQDLIDLLGNYKSAHGLNGKRNPMLSSLEEYLKKQGVDTDKFSDMDFMRLIDLRKSAVEKTAPKGKHVISTQLGDYTEYSLKENGETLGTLSTILKGNKHHVGSVYKFKGKGVSKDLYNSALHANKQLEKPGLIAGETLQSPEQTLYIYNKYFPKRRIVSNTGVHTYNNGLNVEKTGKLYTDKRGDVFDLNEPSEVQLPMKSQNVFHPSMIDKVNKTIKVDWNDKDIFKTLFPTIPIFGTQTNID